MQSAIVGQSEDLKKNFNMVNFLYEKWMLFVCVCVPKFFALFNISMFVNVLLLARTYVRMLVYVLA